MPHGGMDFRASLGEAIPSAGPGTVIHAKQDQFGGLYICVNHGSGVITWYWHLDAFSVSEGDEVVAGQKLGAAGRTGLTSDVHLHFEVRVDGIPRNPRELVGAASAIEGRTCRSTNR